MPTARLLALLLLIATSAVAQNRMPKPIPLEVSNEINPTGGFSPRPIAPVALPDAPTPHRIIDKKFIAVMVALGGAESLRFTTRKLVLDHEFAAGAPWVTSVPQNQHLVAKYAGLYCGRIARNLRTQEAPLLASRRQGRPQTLVGVSRDHGGHPYQERSGQHAHAGPRGLHNG